MGEPGRGALGQQRIDRHAGADVLVVAVVRIEGRLTARIERRIGVTEEGWPISSASQLREQGRVPQVERNSIADRSMLVGVKPGHKPRACRTTGIGLAVMLAETRRVPREGIEVRRAGERMMARADEIATPLIDRYEQDIRARFHGPMRCQAGNTCASRGSTLIRTRSPMPISAVSRLGQSAFR